MKRLTTKEDRLNSQKYQFESLLNSGYTQETYKGLNIFTKAEGKYFTLKIFKNTASHHIQYMNYRSEESRAQAIQGYKDSFDRNQAYKAELKANPKKSSAANASAAIKAELKTVFPNVKFSVKSDNFSMGNSVHVSWTDGPTANQVQEITGKYQYGHFNGMEDIYEYSNNREDIPQAKYVSEHREISEEVNNLLLPQLTELMGEVDPGDWRNTPGSVLNRILSKTPLGAKITGIVRTETMAGFTEDFYRVTFEANATQERKTIVANGETTFEKVEVPAGEIQIIDYSEKAIAVIGDTKSIKDKLKALGGKFNFRLSVGPGWIFPKTKLNLLQTSLTA